MEGVLKDDHIRLQKCLDTPFSRYKQGGNKDNRIYNYIYNEMTKRCERKFISLHNLYFIFLSLNVLLLMLSTWHSHCAYINMMTINDNHYNNDYDNIYGKQMPTWYSPVFIDHKDVSVALLCCFLHHLLNAAASPPLGLSIRDDAT